MRKNHRALNCESLESRELMAGNVQVSVVNNEVVVRGDSQANQIRVAQLNNGAYRVFGLNGTKVNGQSSVDRTSIDRDLRIFMGSGDDTVLLGDFAYLGGNMLTGTLTTCEDLEIDMGAGADALHLGNVKTIDNQFTSIKMGGLENDNDFLKVGFSTFKTGLKLEMGGGKDQAQIFNSKINGKLDVNLGSGDDSIQLVDTIFSTSSINGGSGTDSYKRTRGTATNPVSFEKFL